MTAVDVAGPAAAVVRDPDRPETWIDDGACHADPDLLDVFFAPYNERRDAREAREAAAASICGACPVLVVCREYARRYETYGYWGGESEDTRRAARRLT